MCASLSSSDGVAGVHGDECSDHPPSLPDVVSQSLQVRGTQEKEGMTLILNSRGLFSCSCSLQLSTVFKTK